MIFTQYLDDISIYHVILMVFLQLEVFFMDFIVQFMAAQVDFMEFSLLKWDFVACRMAISCRIAL